MSYVGSVDGETLSPSVSFRPAAYWLSLLPWVHRPSPNPSFPYRLAVMSYADGVSGRYLGVGSDACAGRITVEGSSPRDDVLCQSSVSEFVYLYECRACVSPESVLTSECRYNTSCSQPMYRSR